MKYVTTTLLLISSIYYSYSQKKTWENDNLVRGETLCYKIKYGWFKIGEAEVYNDEKFHLLEGEPHYLVQFKLRTVGWLRIFANIDLQFETSVNAKNFRPHHASRVITNSGKSNIQKDRFNYKDSIYVETYREEKKETTYHSYPLRGADFTDALSTYLYVRGQNLDMKTREKVRFYIANRLYDFEMKPDASHADNGRKYYELIFPPIKQFPRDRTSYAILDERRNIPLEIKLSTNDGSFYLFLDN